MPFPRGFGKGFTFIHINPWDGQQQFDDVNMPIARSVGKGFTFIHINPGNG